MSARVDLVMDVQEMLMVESLRSLPQDVMTKELPFLLHSLDQEPVPSVTFLDQIVNM
jgi:hypothetical protein